MSLWALVAFLGYTVGALGLGFLFGRVARLNDTDREIDEKYRKLLTEWNKKNDHDQ